VRDNARATRDKRVLDSLDDGLSSDDCVFSQQARTFEPICYGTIPRLRQAIS
jgi:hypothetical protein